MTHICYSILCLRLDCSIQKYKSINLSFRACKLNKIFFFRATLTNYKGLESWSIIYRRISALLLQKTQRQQKESWKNIASKIIHHRACLNKLLLKKHSFWQLWCVCVCIFLSSFHLILSNFTGEIFLACCFCLSVLCVSIKDSDWNFIAAETHRVNYFTAGP